MQTAAISKGAEKRRHPRFPMGISMDIQAKGHSVGRCRGTITDLSMGGMSFHTDAVLDQGMLLYLKLNIPLEIRGEVKHMDGNSSSGMQRYGVKFHKIGVPEASRPERFISAKFQKLKMAR